MADIFTASKGVYSVIAGTQAKSIIAIDGFDPGNSALVSDAAISRVEKHDLIQCLGGFNYIFAFGNNPVASSYSITFTMFLGEECKGDGGGGVNSKVLDKVVEFFEDHKVSKKKFITYVFGSKSYRGILISYSVRTADPAIGTISVTFNVLGTEDMDV